MYSNLNDDSLLDVWCRRIALGNVDCTGPNENIIQLGVQGPGAPQPEQDEVIAGKPCKELYASVHCFMSLFTCSRDFTHALTCAGACWGGRTTGFLSGFSVMSFDREWEAVYCKVL